MNSKKKAIGRATRPIFIPNPNQVGVIDFNITFDWHMGMSAPVKRRSIESLHQQAANQGFSPILEVSSKSMQKLGVPLSAFFLKNDAGYLVENLFQSSKVFQFGGPFQDLLTISPKDAKRDQRLKNSGKLIEFNLDGQLFPLEPKTLFYDWLYIKTLTANCNVALQSALIKEDFAAFSDIEFNPQKSLNCQGRALGLFLSLHQHNLLDQFLANPKQMTQTHRLYRNASYLSEQELF